MVIGEDFRDVVPHLGEFKIDIKYSLSLGDIPRSLASTTKKFCGRNIPKKKKKLAATVRQKRSSSSGWTKSDSLKGLGLGLILDLTVRFATTKSAKIVKAMILVVHPYPNLRKEMVCHNTC